MKTYGKYLKEKRKNKNISLENAAKSTKIKLHHLMAIEDESIDDIMGQAYAKLKVLNYARFLGDDSNKILLLFDMHNQNIENKKNLFLTNKKKKKYEHKVLIHKNFFQILGLVIFVSLIFTIGLHLYKQDELQRGSLSKSSQEVAQSQAEKSKIESPIKSGTKKFQNHFKYKEEDFLKKYILAKEESPWYILTEYIKND